MVTWPPPYSPFGISPANLKYSRGWSSTWTARWFFFGSGGMPFGTAQDTPTPSFSRRKSQCNRRAWCSCTTNLSALGCFRGTLAPGSGVFLKSRLASYSASFLATRKRLLVLCEPHLEADSCRRDLAGSEWAFRRQLFELRRRVRAARQHL